MRFGWRRLWNQRLFLLHGDAKYVDVLERTLYNGLISGVSPMGKRSSIRIRSNPTGSISAARRLESPAAQVTLHGLWRQCRAMCMPSAVTL